MEEDPEAYLKLPLEDRLVHQLWKARVSGYEEAIKLFPTLDGDDAAWKKYLGIVKKFILDSNAIAQEKGLEAALGLVVNCDAAGKVAGDCVEAIVAKCVAATRAKTKDLANQLILTFVEIEQQERVLEELVKGLGQKNPKMVAGCIRNLTSCLKNFGAKVVKVSPILKAVVKILDHRDKNCREEGKTLIVEAYRWVGDIMKAQLAGLKPVQLSELEGEFEKVEDCGKAKPLKFLRSQQQSAAENQDADEDEGKAEEEPEADDPYDLMDGVNILEKLPGDFYELCEQKKWQERQQALDSLLPLTKNPKIENGDFNDLVRVLKRFISKDTNVMLVTKAAQCVAGIAKGLRLNFKNGAGTLLPVILEKFKEKKPAVLAALCEAADSLYPCLGIEAVQEDCLASLKHKTPAVVAETAKFLARSFATCPGALVTNKKMVKGYVCALVEVLNHSDPNVREGGSEAIGVLIKVLGEPNIMKFMPDVDPIKVNKVKEYADKAVLTGKLPKQTQAAPAPTAPGGPRVVKPEKKAVKKPPGTGAAAPSKPAAEPAKAAAPTARKVSSAKAKVTAAKPATGGSKKKEDVDLSPPYTSNELKKQRLKDEARLKVLKWNFSTPRSEFVDQLKEQIEAANFNTTLQTQMFHSDFKQHLKVIDSLAKHLEADVPGLVSNLDLILKWITLRFFETNPSVLLKALEYLNDVFSVLSAEPEYAMHDVEAQSFIPYLVSKVGDPKDQVRSSIRAIFKSMCMVYPVSKFSPFLMEGLKHKNAKLRAECLDEIGAMIKNHGMNVLQTPAACLKEVAKSISDRDNSVRNAALNAITEAFFRVGEKMYKMVGNLPEKDMAMLEERIKRTSKTRGPPALAAPSDEGANGHLLPGHQPLPPRQTQSAIPKSGIPNPGSRIRNFRQFPVPGGGPAPNIPPPSSSAQEVLPRKPSSPEKPRPISGAFTLDMDFIENLKEGAPSDFRTNVSMHLIKHDLDDILNEEGVRLPSTQTGKMRPTTAPVRSPEKPSADEAVDVTLGQIFSTDVSTCLTALANIEELLKDESKAHVMESRVDQLLVGCFMQYRNVLSRSSLGGRESLKLYQYVTMVLLSLYHFPGLTTRATLTPLKDLLEVIIEILIDPSIPNLVDSDKNQLFKALNVLTVKILDRSDPTVVTCVFLRVLTESVGVKGAKNIELVMKCLWKVIRHLPKWMEQSLNCDSVLLDLHLFMKQYPSQYWKRQELDTPMRTVKTIIHTMVKARGDAILDNLSLIKDPGSSELVPYLRKLLSNGVGGKENHSSAPPVKRFSKTDHDALAEIFKKIGDKDLTKEGLYELKVFKQQNPQADVEPYLAKSSQYFRNYIERGLATIDATPVSDKVLTESNEDQDSGTSSVFLNKLKILREKGGLDSNIGSTAAGTATTSLNAYRITSSSSTSSAASAFSAAVEEDVSSGNAGGGTNLNIEEIRKRLEKIKNGGGV